MRITLAKQVGNRLYAIKTPYSRDGTPEAKESRRQRVKRLESVVRRTKREERALSPEDRQTKRIVNRIRKIEEKWKRRRAKHPDPILPKEEDRVETVNENSLIASICKKSFYDFVREFWDTVVSEVPHWNWHIRYLCDLLQKMAERVFRSEKKLYDLLVNIPPGTTKSTIISVMFPAWAWTRMPSFRFIGASYSEELAMELSTKTRDIVQSDKYRACFPNIKLREDQNTKTFFKNTENGWRYAVGTNGSVTGKHAHFIGIDDPLDPEQSYSEAELKSANRWIRETLSSRKVDFGIVPMVLVMQRLHEDDPSAQFLRKSRIFHVCLPAEDGDNVNPPELRANYVDGLLDPIRRSKEVLEEIQEDPESGYLYAAQYLQNPVPRGGGMFKVEQIKLQTYIPKKFVRMVRYWDKAGTAAGGNYTVGTLMGMDEDGRYWLLDVVRGRWDAYEREIRIQETADRDGDHVLIVVEQEPGSSGKEAAEATIRKLAGYKVRADKVGKSEGSKQERADPFSYQVNGGNVHVPASSAQTWLPAWKSEHKFFPNSKYKDQVDSSAGAFAYCSRRRIRCGGAIDL